MPDRTLTDADAEAIAEHMTNKLVQRISDRETVEQITEAWSGHFDRSLGRGLRRIGFWVLGLLLAFGAVKFELLSKFLTRS